MGKAVNSRSIRLGSKTVRAFADPYIIAEIGVNHEGSLDLAKRLIELAKEGGADGAKFQTYKAEKLASKHSPSYWDLSKEPTRSQYELFKKYDAFGPKEYEALAEHCRKVGIDFLSTPFDDDAADFLAPWMPFIKVASADLNNLPLLRRVGSKRKPVLLSTGASRLEEVDLALTELQKAGAPEVILLHCILNYPTADENANLGMILDLRARYPAQLVGYSDHTVPSPEMTSVITAFHLGACVIEKHFTHDKTLPGNDHYHAMDVRDLRNLRTRLQKSISLLGEFEKRPLASEEISRQNARRSVVAATHIPKGTRVTEAMITYKRPGTGISTSDWDRVIGKTAKTDLAEDTVLQWDMLSG